MEGIFHGNYYRVTFRMAERHLPHTRDDLRAIEPPIQPLPSCWDRYGAAASIRSQLRF